MKFLYPLLFTALLLAAGMAAAEENKPVVVVLPLRGVAAAPGTSSDVSSAVFEALSKSPGISVMPYSRVATLREKEPDHGAKVAAVRSALKQALQKYDEMKFTEVDGTLARIEKAAPEICADFLYPDIPRNAWQLRGLAAHAQGDEGQAAGFFGKAAKADPASGPAYMDRFHDVLERCYWKSREVVISRKPEEPGTQDALACVSPAEPDYLVMPQIFFEGKTLNLSIHLYDVGKAKEVSLKNIPLEASESKLRKTVSDTVFDLLSLAGVSSGEKTSMPEAPPPPSEAAFLPEERPPSPVAPKQERPAVSAGKPALPGAGVNYAAWSFAGLAAVSAGLAVTFGLLEMKAEADIENLASRNSQNKVSLGEYENLRNKGEQMALLANVFWGVTAASAAVSAGFFISGFGKGGQEAAGGGSAPAFSIAPSGRGLCLRIGGGF